MEIVDMPIGQIKPYKKNPRKNEKAVPEVVKSIKEFGFRQPLVVDSSMVLIVGHTRLLAAKELGLATVPVHIASTLTPALVRAYRIADNRSHDRSEWDVTILNEELEELFDMDEKFDLDFMDFSLDDLDREEEPKEGLTDPDEVPEDVEPRVKLGQVWQLGEHRLMCGDSTNLEAVEKLMNGQKADMVFSDPPYGENSGGLKPYEGQEKKNRQKQGKSLVYQDTKILNDKNIDWLKYVFPILPVKENSTKLIFFKWDKFNSILEFANCWGFPSALLVWDRVKRSNNFFRFQPQHELIFHWGNQSDKRATSSLSNVFSIEKDEEKDLHPTVKPIALLQPMIEVCCSKKELILDPFLGSGSTLIACEKTDRICYGMELDPNYCDVIIERWEKYTGETASLLS